MTDDPKAQNEPDDRAVAEALRKLERKVGKVKPGDRLSYNPPARDPGAIYWTGAIATLAILASHTLTPIGPSRERCVDVIIESADNPRIIRVCSLSAEV